MAATVTETYFTPVGGGPGGYATLTGHCLATAVTTIVIKPGNDDVNVAGSAGLLKFYDWSFTNNVSANAFKVVKTYDNTQGGDILTITCTSGDGFDFKIGGYSAGIGGID